MEPFKQYSFRSAIVLLFFLSCKKAYTTELTCQDNWYNGKSRCLINNIVINSTEIASLKFPVRESIELTYVQVDYISKELMERMKWVSELTINYGQIRKIYLKPDLQRLVATQSNTFELIIGGERNDYLEELTITSNNLKTIPENLNKLKALKTISLSGNQISVVDSNKLNELEKVTSIDLSRNRIYHIVTSDNDWNLVRLKVLDLSGNYLKELNFNNYNFQRLETLQLSSNHLTYLASLDENKFPVLREINLNDNLFDCRWRDEFLNTLKNITHSETSLDCSRMIQLSTVTYNKLNISDVRSGGFQFDNKEQLEEQITNIVEVGVDQSKFIKTLENLISHQAEHIAEANAKLVAQQGLIDNLMVRLDDLATQMEQLKQQEELSPFRSVSKGFTDKLIREISEVVRRNLQEE